MPAWTAGIQVRRDASGDIHVNLGSGTPCRNDDIEEYSLKLTKLSVANSRTPKNPRVTLHAVISIVRGPVNARSANGNYSLCDLCIICG